MVKLNCYSFGLCKQIGLKKSINRQNMSCLWSATKPASIAIMSLLHEISNDVVCAANKGYAQSDHLFVCLI